MMRLAYLLALLIIAFSPLSLAALRMGAEPLPAAVNITVPKPGLTLEKVSVTGDSVVFTVRNTAAEPIPVESASVQVEAPFNLSCTTEAPPLIQQARGCAYDSARDPTFKPQVIRPGEVLVAKVQLSGLVELLQPSWKSEALVTLKLGSYTLRKRLSFTATLSGEASQPEPRTVRVVLKVEGNATLRVLLKAVLRANASLQNLRGVSLCNFTGGLELEGGALKLAGEATPPARLELNLSVSAPAGAESGYVAPLLLQLQGGGLKLASLVFEAKAVLLKPGLLPYTYEVSVPEAGSGYLLVAVGPHIYNVTLREGRGFLVLSEAFWPLLHSCEVRPLEVVVERGAASYPAVPAGGEATLLTGGATLALIAALASASGVYALLLYRLRKKCKPYVEVEME